MRARPLPLGLVLVGLVTAGCRNVGPHDGPPGVFLHTPRPPSQSGEASSSKRKHPATLPKWNPLWWAGNVDDPWPPDDYHPCDPCRLVRWGARNPFHNFTFYVVGVADREFIRVGRDARGVFHPRGGWNWAVIQHRRWRLPFISYRGASVKFYLGWRERGNFGCKWTLRERGAGSADASARPQASARATTCAE